MLKFSRSLERLSPRPSKSGDKWVSRGLLLLITLYQGTLSLVFGKCCRFEPSCSHYASEAVRKHSIGHALILILKRLSKCHPFHEGGYDPV